MYCKFCGSQIDDDSNYCRSCGLKVTEGLHSHDSPKNTSSSADQSKNINVNLSIGGIGRRKAVTAKKPSHKPKKTEKYPKDIPALIFGIVCMIGILVISLVGGIENEDIYIPVSIALIFIRFFIILYANNRAKKLRRDRVAWMILGFLFPLISLVILGLLPRKRITVQGNKNETNTENIITSKIKPNSEAIKSKSSPHVKIVRVLQVCAAVIVGLTGIVLLISIWIDDFDYLISRIVFTNIVLLLAILLVRLILLFKK